MTTTNLTAKKSPERQHQAKPTSSKLSRQPGPYGPYASIMRLQRAAGNHAINRLLETHTGGQGIVQPKLAVSRPGDACEGEADRVADEVTSNSVSSPTVRLRPARAGIVQRQPKGPDPKPPEPAEAEKLGSGLGQSAEERFKQQEEFIKQLLKAFQQTASAPAKPVGESKPEEDQNEKNYKQAAKKLALAASKTEAGKALTEWAKGKGKELLKGVFSDAGTATASIAAAVPIIGGLIAGMVAKGEELPLEDVDIPLDWITAGLEMNLKFKGPFNLKATPDKPVEGGITFKYTFGASGEKKTESDSEMVRADIARLKAIDEMFRKGMRYKEGTPEAEREKAEKEAFERWLYSRIKPPGQQAEEWTDKFHRKYPGISKLGSDSITEKNPFRLRMPRPGEKGSSPFQFRKPSLIDKDELELNRKGRDDSPVTEIPDSVRHSLDSSGQSLDASTRTLMESSFGHDFSQVRVHTDAKAAESARSVNAFAYTVGNNIVFDTGQYSPTTSSGKRLLAHELTHTIQQSTKTAIARPIPESLGVSRLDTQAEHEADKTTAIANGSRSVDTIRQTSSIGTIQRQKADQQAANTARTVFPYPEKSRLLFNRLLDDEQIEALEEQAKDDPNNALALRLLRAAEGQGLAAIVKIASDDLFEAVIPSVDLPKNGKNPAQTVKDVALRFSRQTDGKFVFELKVGSTTLFGQSGIAVSKNPNGEVVLSPPKGPTAIVRPGSDSGQLEIVGDLDIFEIRALQITKLPDVPIGSAEEKKVIQQITQKAKETRRERRQEVTLGVGAQSGAKWDPVFTVSWRVSFNPTAKTGGAVQIPVRVDIEYAPDKSVLAGASLGGELALPTKIPVNVRIVGGVAGGGIEGTASGGGKPPLLPAFGPTIGAGIGVGGKVFRVEVDVQHLQNLVRSSPNVDTVVVSGGIKF